MHFVMECVVLYPCRSIVTSDATAKFHLRVQALQAQPHAWLRLQRGTTYHQLLREVLFLWL